MSTHKSRSRGDTIVETIIAFAIFSAVVVGTILVMNRGVAMAQRSLEVTLTREHIDGQGEMLRYIRNNIPGLWTQLTAPERIERNPAPLTSATNTCPAPTGQAYFIRGGNNASPEIITTSSSVNYAAPQIHAQIDHLNRRSYGVWVETTEAQGTQRKAYDFRIHACWSTMGSDVPMTLGTIVRLYEQ